MPPMRLRSWRFPATTTATSPPAPAPRRWRHSSLTSAPRGRRAARGWGRRRRAINQRNVYWTLEHDWVTIIGLYTNVPEGGTIDADQLRWLTAELGAARRGAALSLAMHHPIYSLESAHGSSLELGVALDRFAEAGRAPDVVIAAHAHNYQRFARRYENRLIPDVVAGTGGFPELHRLAGDG